MMFSEDQIAQIEDRVMNLVQRPLCALEQSVHRGSIDQTLVSSAIADLGRLVEWARALREPTAPTEPR